jgi:predicted metal-dependent hydrolase
MPEEFLKMIVVHELAHIKVRDHGKSFYQLCCHMEPKYHQYEFDLRSYLSWLEYGGQALWENSSP